MHKYEMWADGGRWRSRQGERGEGEEDMSNYTERLKGLICISLNAAKESGESYICIYVIRTRFIQVSGEVRNRQNMNKPNVVKRSRQVHTNTFISVAWMFELE